MMTVSMALRSRTSIERYRAWIVAKVTFNK